MTGGLVLDRVCKSYGSEMVVRDVSLTIPQGEFFTLLGPSGSGKTTTLSMIAGFVLPDTGRIEIGGRETTRLPPRERGLGMVFQNYAIFPHLDVFENVAFPLRQHLRLPEELVRNIVLTRLQAVGLRGAAALMPAELSGGMARRVALARAIVRDPSLMIYDEPFVGLDPIALNQVLELIRTLNDSLGITSILVAHEFAAVRRVADHVYLIAGGKVVAEGHPDELAGRESPWTRQFFGGEADGPVPFEYPARDYAADLGFPAGRA